MARDVERFFIIGAQRSGTTLLHRALGQHPEIALNEPATPEPKHFLASGSEATAPAAYDACYSVDTDRPVRGEKSTTYLERPDAAPRILACFPQARFLVVVRDPVERALSNYRLSRTHGFEPLPVREALTEVAEDRDWDRARLSASPYAYLRRGLYAQQLRPWARAVGPQRILVVLFEDLVAGAALVTAQRFLGVRVDDRVRVPGVVNPSNAHELGDDVEEMRERLAAYYAGANAELAEEWQLNLGSWRSPRH